MYIFWKYVGLVEIYIDESKYKNTKILN